LSDSAAPERVIIAAKDDPKIALSPGIQWKDGGAWVGLADFYRFDPPPRPRVVPMGVYGPPLKPPDVPEIQRIIYAAGLAAGEAETSDFLIRYELGTRTRKAKPAKGAWGADLYDPPAPAQWIVTERYTVTADGVRCRQTVEPGARKIDATRFVFPALVNDGNRDADVSIAGNTMTVRRTGGVLHLNVIEPTTAALKLTGPRVAMHNGYYRAASVDLSTAAPAVEWNVTLDRPTAPSP
jgi:hypothetical protein